MWEFCDLGASPRRLRWPAPSLSHFRSSASKYPPYCPVVRAGLDEGVDRDRLVQGRLVGGRPVVFRERVDAEDLPVDLLVVVERLAVRRDRPEEAARLLVPEMVHEVPEGPRRHLEVRRVVVGAVGRGERPEDAAGKERPAVHVLADGHVRLDEAVVAAVLRVARVLHPEGKDVPLQLLLRARGQGRELDGRGVVVRGCVGAHGGNLRQGARHQAGEKLRGVTHGLWGLRGPRLTMAAIRQMPSAADKIYSRQ
jgi:hypothetical protein